MKIFLISYGCKLNQALSRTLDIMGSPSSVETDSEADADVIVISGCAVTSKAESEFRRKANSFKKKYPEKKIIISGCVTKDTASLLSEIEYSPQNPFYRDRAVIPNRTRENIVIQNGCTSFCSYCIVPYMRGPEVSVERSLIIERAERAVKEGVKEVVLTGVHILRYSDSEGGFTSLLRDIKSTGISRIRLTSLDIDRIDEELLGEIASDNITARYMHLSLQHTDDYILRRMKRKYDTKGIEKMLRMIESAIPDIRLGADIIAGFPGETEERFKGMIAFLKESPVSHYHIFSFSPRKGTLAYYMDGAPEHDDVRKRHSALSELSASAYALYIEKLRGSAEDVIIEAAEDGEYSGTSSHYLKMKFRSSKKHVKGEMLKVTLNGMKGKDILCTEHADEG